MTAFCERHAGLKSLGGYIDHLRSALRDDPEISTECRAALIRARVPRATEPQTPSDQGYSDTDWQLIMTSQRREIRLTCDQIRVGRDLLRRFRAGGLLHKKDAQAREELAQGHRVTQLPFR
ncbi:MAG TPA: hypothetical protein VFG87_03085 [Amycolatopsis sp.]|nr:hypothetical protein [Amycolatopsis sp.]